MKFPRKVYAIQHNVTKKIYVGSSNNVENRYLNHIYALRKHKHGVEDLQQDYDEYGEDFSLFILDEINCYEERKKEFEWMKKYNTLTRGVGYNYKDNFKKGFQVAIPYKDGTPSTDNVTYVQASEIKQEYIEQIQDLLCNTNDLTLLDLVCKMLDKEV